MVPGLQVGQAQVLGGKGFQLGQVALGMRAGAPCQVAQKVQHLVGRLGHLRHQRQVGITGLAQQRGFFLAQLQQFGHQRAVVECGRAQLAGAGGIGLVELLAQRPVAGVLHHRQVDRHVQVEQVAGLALGLGGLGGLLQHVGWHTV